MTCIKHFSVAIIVLVMLFTSSSAWAVTSGVSCKGDNAPGTPSGSECRCSASGDQAVCVTHGGAAWCADWNGDSFSVVYCIWNNYGPEKGCVCKKHPASHSALDQNGLADDFSLGFLDNQSNARSIE